MLQDYRKWIKRCCIEAKQFWKTWGRTAACILAAAFLLNFGAVKAHGIMLQQGIAEEVLRFHVLANSDSEEDQRIKYLVRDEVIAWLGEEMEGKKDYGKEAALQFLSGHLAQLEQMADKVLGEEGAAYRSEASVEDCYFPARTYGECTFPAGWYKALRIRLGEAEGQNWWCVLYPRLCFSDCLHGVVEEDQMQQLEEVLTVEEYESLLRKPGEWKIAFRWF